MGVATVPDAAPDVIDLGSINLREGVFLCSGEVVDRTGEAVPDIQASPSHASGIEVVTDGNQFHVLCAGENASPTIVVTARGHAREFITLSPNKSHYRVVLDQAAAFVVSVEFPAGIPSQLLAARIIGPHLRSAGLPVAGDSRHISFEWSQLPVGEYELEVNSLRPPGRLLRQPLSVGRESGFASVSLGPCHVFRLRPPEALRSSESFVSLIGQQPDNRLEVATVGDGWCLARDDAAEVLVFGAHITPRLVRPGHREVVHLENGGPMRLLFRNALGETVGDEVKVHHIDPSWRQDREVRVFRADMGRLATLGSLLGPQWDGEDALLYLSGKYEVCLAAAPERSQTVEWRASATEEVVLR